MGSLHQHDVPVLVCGAGPVGLITALKLAHHGIRCMLIERNFETTKWPKMDITNVRSMELLRTLNLTEELKEIGMITSVPPNYSLDVIFSTGLGNGGEKIATWDLPSPDAWRERIRTQNDGSMPRESYLRCSQVLFEAWLKPICQKNPLIQTHFGYKFEELKEEDDFVISTLTDLESSKKILVKSKYVVACDGAGSRVRKSTGLKITGGPVPISQYLVHFKSRDLTRLQSQGQFWHIFFTGGGAIISQDEDEIWTVHLPLPLEEDTDKIDPYEVVYKLLGSNTGRFPIKIDEILVKSVWRPNLVVADEYRTKKGRVFLCGDSAHQNIPTGGYGMNMGVGDSYDIGWKLAAVLRGFGGEHLLDSYEYERRPVALRNVERSGQHQSVHWEYCNWVQQEGSKTVLSQGQDGKELKNKIKDWVEKRDGENKDHGIEMGYRHTGSPIVLVNPGEREPEWNVRDYVPSTWPGNRAPHVFLNDGKTSIFDLYGPDYTIVDFTASGTGSAAFFEASERLRIPVKVVHLPTEDHVCEVWGRKLVLIRPDGFVAWRGLPGKEEVCPNNKQIDEILLVAVGQHCVPDYSKAQYVGEKSSQTTSYHEVKTAPFTATVGNVMQDMGSIQKMAAFQT
ncbi:FAD-dependent monooxygenase [Lachnellula willkommii]|uniref:FAD-dependent monooxygenase n=1 Tax=Lachnellula willkommii TaxID=215461 RepID=A0A559MJQ0_9HELO|nr:FAD-dependent monooxygenase [Lachnellula willkommii]